MPYGETIARSSQLLLIVIRRFEWPAVSASVIACSTKLRSRWQKAVSVASGASHSAG
jgi:hypothetical protein